LSQSWYSHLSVKPT